MSFQTLIALYLALLLDIAPRASLGNVYINSPSVLTAISPLVKAARFVSSRRARERDMPADAARSEAATGSPPALSTASMTLAGGMFSMRRS